MTKKVIKLEKEDLTPEKIKAALKVVQMRQIRDAVRESVAYGIYKAQWYNAHPEVKKPEEE